MSMRCTHRWARSAIATARPRCHHLHPPRALVAPQLRRLSTASTRSIPQDGKTLTDFIRSSVSDDIAPTLASSSASITTAATPIPQPAQLIDDDDELSNNTTPAHQPRRYYIETYGCQMNNSDSEIVESVLQSSGFIPSDSLTDAAVILVNTCAIRENAESKIWQRLRVFRALHQNRPQSQRPLVAVLGCMAERLKHKLLEDESLVDIVVGPDGYRDLPRLIDVAYSGSGEQAVNVQLSLDETYSDLAPVRRSSNEVSAFVSIMRGCDNMCSYCIVPFTRGRERSRDSQSIIDEIRQLSDQGYKEVTLLGQNVNSYAETVTDSHGRRTLSQTREAKTKGFVNISKRPLSNYDFTSLIADVSEVDSELRVRFVSPHPKDFPDDLLSLIAERPNLCKSLHLPAQSGSSSVLERMRRGYTREAYLSLIDRVRTIIGPMTAISTDMISGFCDETDSEHSESVSLMELVQYDHAFMFAYSQRDKTHAHRTMADNIPESVKLVRLQQIIDQFHASIKVRNATLVGSIQCVLVEGKSKRSQSRLTGRIDGNRRAVFDEISVPLFSEALATPLTQSNNSRAPRPGDYVAVEVLSATAVSLRCRALGRTTLKEFAQFQPLSVSVYPQRIPLDAAVTKEVVSQMIH